MKWILFAHNGLEYGPVEEEELISWIREKRVSADDLVRRDMSSTWELAGEIDIFSLHFKNRPGEAGRIKKALRNESEKLKERLKKATLAAPLVGTSNGANRVNCEGCTFVEGIERLHEEKKVLEEKLAEKKAQLREHG